MLNNLIVNPVSLLGRLAGPMLDKELRVLSRRRSTYAVRVGYLLFLAALVTMEWLILVRPMAAAGVVAAARMGDVAALVVVGIVWFQFIGAQVLAAVSMAGCLQEEMRGGTFDVLVASGIGGLQIVLGKVLSRLVPIVMALAMGLPLLAVVRLWGGVPGDYVIAGFCITLTAVLLAASVSLLFSIRGAPAHRVTLRAATCLVVFWILGSLWSGAGAGLPQALAKLLLLVDPFAMMTETTTAMTDAGQAAMEWPVHCGTIVLISVVLLAVSACMLGRGAPVVPRRRLGWCPRRPTRPDPRRVTPPVILWKDYGPCPGRRALRQVGLAVLVGGLLAVLLRVSTQRFAMAKPIWGVLSVGWWLVLALHTAALASLCVAREREGRSWPVLLATPLTRFQIVRDKAASVLLRTLFGWLAFLFYSISYQLVTNWAMGPSFLVPLLLLTVLNTPLYALFLTGTGLYVGLRSRTTFTAVVVTLTVVLGFHFVRQYVMIPLVSILFPLRLSPWLVYHAVNVAVEALVGIVLLACSVRALRRRVF